MLSAALFGLMDSVNLLTIGLLVALGAVLPATARFGRIAALMVVGDWIGVFILALFVLFVFRSFEHYVHAFLDSPWFGILLIVVGVLSAWGTWRSPDAGISSPLVGRLLALVRTPTWKVAAVGFVLGVVQSATSAPFFSGIGVVTVGDYPTPAKYLFMVIYASLALSLPSLSAVLVGIVRRYPYSPAGRLFEWMREHAVASARAAGYAVAVLLIVIGVSGL